MGVPSVRREVHSYLTDTLHSLISELSPQEKEDSVIVVLIAEVSGPGPGIQEYGGEDPQSQSQTKQSNPLPGDGTAWRVGGFARPRQERQQSELQS